MKTVLVLNNLSDKALSLLPTSDYQITKQAEQPHAVLVRSADMCTQDWGNKLIAVGRAGTGVNNIPVAEMSRKGVAVFNAPGANANAVKELVVGSMFMTARKLFSAAEYVKYLEAEESELPELLEKAKKSFSGIELPGYKLGVVGLGAIGVKVANSGVALGMEVYGYDPKISVQNAWHLSAEVHQENSLEKLLQTCDFISVHVPLISATQHLINEENLNLMKSHAVVMNFSRGEIVDDEAMIHALDEGNVGWYVTDFPTLRNKNHPRVLALPHLGASTIQAEELASTQVVEQLKEFIETGNVSYAVNLPEVKAGPIPEGACRIAIVNENHIGMIAKITEIIGLFDINIVEMTNKSRLDVAYSLVDIEGVCAPELLEKLLECEGVCSARFCGV